MQLHLSIVTPTADVLEVECDEVDAPGVNGELGFLPGHVALVTALKPGVLTLTVGSKRRIFAVGTGFAELEGNQVRVLTESCEEAATIDRERAQAALQKALTTLKDLSPDAPGYMEATRRIARAEARLQASERKA